MTNEQTVMACIAVVVAGATVVAALIRMWITSAVLVKMASRISEVEKRADEAEEEWEAFKEANGIDEKGNAHPWKISVFHPPAKQRRTA